MSNTNNESFETLSKEILEISSSLRWIAIADSEGHLLNIASREGLDPLMTREENQVYTLNAIARHKSRIKFEEKLGKLVYSRSEEHTSELQSRSDLVCRLLL